MPYKKKERYDLYSIDIPLSTVMFITHRAANSVITVIEQPTEYQDAIDNEMEGGLLYALFHFAPFNL